MKLSEDQQRVLDLVKDGKSVFISGKAGTGKSFLINEIKKVLKRNYVVLAPTGVAASNVKGQTIHSLFSIKPFGILNKESANWVKGWKRRMYDNIQTIIIDEVSMVRPDIIDCIHYTLEKNDCYPLQGKQLIFVGDLKQLQPILKKGNESNIFYEEYSSLDFRNAKCLQNKQIEEIELTTIFRQKDNDLINGLNDVREGLATNYFDKFETSQHKGITLCATNSLCDYINETELDKLEGDLLTFEGEIEGEIKESDVVASRILKVKHSCKVMYLRNDEELQLVNGDIGTLEVKKNSLFFVKGDQKVKVEKSKFEVYEYLLNNEGRIALTCKGFLKQYPIKPCYALTVHKSQGLSLDEVTIDLTDAMFADNQYYVALSRVRTEQGLNIVKKNEDYLNNKDNRILKLLGY